MATEAVLAGASDRRSGQSISRQRVYCSQKTPRSDSHEAICLRNRSELNVKLARAMAQSTRA
jgi:hypothetical protein